MGTKRTQAAVEEEVNVQELVLLLNLIEENIGTYPDQECERVMIFTLWEVRGLLRNADLVGYDMLVDNIYEVSFPIT